MRENWISEVRAVDHEDQILGIDLGIASCGWALIRDPEKGGGIIALGVRMFDAPETDKERTPTNQLRRTHRGLRRVLRRRRQRMRDIRQLFKTHQLIGSDNRDALRIAQLDPWQLRAEALDRKLRPEELAVTLAHIARHRGFKSNSKRDQGANAPDETSKMKKQIEANRKRLGQYRTVGELFAREEEFAQRKRNRDGNFDRSVLRDDQLREVQLICDAQRRAGNAVATAELERAFIDIAFRQLPLQDSEDRVGFCNFEKAERRAAKRSYSFELFRFLSRLTTIRLKSGRAERALTPEEVTKASQDFGTQNGMTFKRFRTILGLDAETFDGIPKDEEGKRDIVNRTPSNGCMQGTNAIRKCLGDPLFAELAASGDQLDRIAFVITFREDIASIKRGLEELRLDTAIVATLMKGVDEGDFSAFKGAGHLSAKACRAITPHLAAGLTYDKACAAAGYDHAAQAETGIDQIANPIARKAFTEALKQVKAIVDKYGMPGRMHIELARDVGKSQEERDDIRKGIEKRNKEKDRLREDFKATVGQDATNAEDLMRFELWREQNGRCMYTDREIHPDAIVSTERTIEVDHLLPWSRSGDDSFVNKTLCYASANQQKKGQTPFEWLGADSEKWDDYVARVETNKAMKGRKKRNYLLKDATILETKFRERNLNDTRYATRVLLNTLARKYPRDSRVHVFSRPGPLTDRLRRGWGIQGMKKTTDGERLSDDRHHALDALICAATTQSELQKLTRAFQDAERAGSHRDFSRLDPPWPGFVEETKAQMAEIFVSRPERQRARGEGHAATIRSIGEIEGTQRVYERKSIMDLKPADLERIKDPERNRPIVESLGRWIDAKKPKDQLPRSPKGDVIRKVSLITNKKIDVLVRGGAADRGDMVRVDLFSKPNKRGKAEFYLVPVYRHQIADKMDWPTPPNQAVAGNTPEIDWPSMGNEYSFYASIFPMSFIEIEQRDGTLIDGYFRGLDRNTGAIAVSPHYSNEGLTKGIGARTLNAFRKFSVDRLGRRFEIKREQRTWHGKVCI
jgi:CRISPR-associated endonuclease Csn1